MIETSIAKKLLFLLKIKLLENRTFKNKEDNVYIK